MRRIFFLLILLATFSFSSPSYAFWFWRSSTNKLENPKYPHLKTNPQKQFNFAEQFYKKKNYRRAKDEFRRLIKHYHDSIYAYRAQFYIGKIYEILGKPYTAFKIYKKCVNDYIYSEKLEDIVQREYEIGNFFLEQDIKKVLGLKVYLPQEKAIEIFKEIKKQAPYTEWGELAQYKLAICYQHLNKSKEAIAEFNKFISNYPIHPMVVSGEANYQIAISYFQNILPVDYDQQSVNEAIKQFENFIINYPHNERVEEAKKKIAILKGYVAEGLFNSASFYLRQGHTESARTYYNEIVDRYGETTWAEKAKRELKTEL